MRKLLKAIGILIAVLLVASLCLVAAVGGGGYYYLLQRPLPQTDGTLRVAGLKARVDVIRDKWGVPHIYAQNEDDLFFAQGYVCAQDRLFQLDFNRRIGSGRLAEVVGEPGLGTDTFMRTLGLRRAAEAEVARPDYDPTARAALDAYARGINAFIETHRDNLPLEFTILGYTPEPWTPADSVVWGKVMAYSLGGNYSSELLRAALIEKLGEDKVRELAPGYPKNAPVIVPPGVSYNGTGAAELLAQAQQVKTFLGVESPGIGSNNWVVAGSKSVTGQPLLANDPHLGIQMPSIWWEVHLVGGRYDVIGATFPGAPGVVIGHNRRIAWGVTNVGPDVQDLYLEKVNPANPHQVEFKGQWEDVQVVQEVIKIKGGTTKTVEVLVTRHGPIVTDVLSRAKQPMSLRWTALEYSPVLPAVLTLDKAGNWDEFRVALSQWSVPSQNFIYADVDGNIGYQTPALIPIRAKGQGLTPAPGWTGEYEWTGYIPFDELPRAYNPPQGYIATANNRVIGDEYPYFISAEWDVGYRATRIVEVLTSKDKLSADDLRTLHADVTSVPARTLVPALLKLQPHAERDDQRRAMETLRGWDYRLTTDSVPAAIYEVWWNRLVHNTFGDELGDLAGSYPSGFALQTLTGLVETPGSAWFDDVTTPDRQETWNDVALRSLDDAAKLLRERCGDDVKGWQWGKLHTTTFAHQLGGVKPLDLIFNKGPFPNGGDGFTVNNTGYDSQYRQRIVPSYRQVIDLSDWSKAVSVHTTGQSGQPGSPHYADFIPLWLAVSYHPMLYERVGIEAQREGTLALTPPLLSK